MTLKTKPVAATYFVKNTALQHVDSIRDLGVILDTKLTFGPHIQSTVMKANRALGVLIRSYQLAKPRGYFKTSSKPQNLAVCQRLTTLMCALF